MENTDFKNGDTVQWTSIGHTLTGTVVERTGNFVIVDNIFRYVKRYGQFYPHYKGKPKTQHLVNPTLLTKTDVNP